MSTPNPVSSTRLASPIPEKVFLSRGGSPGFRASGLMTQIVTVGEAMKYSTLRPMQKLLAVELVCITLIAGCGQASSSAKSAKSVAAPVHAVNYTAEEFTYLVTDPVDVSNSSGGETITAFAAGGAMCCFSLPAKWKPGLKVEVAETVYLPLKEDGSLPSVKKKHLLEVPPYQDGQAGALWVLREPGGSMSIVSSGLQPDHPNWPGKIKGWPVPSPAFQQELLERAIADAQSTVDVFVTALEELRMKPEKIATEAWTSKMNTDPAQVVQFAGPSDPAFVETIRKNFESELAYARADLKKLESARQ